MGATETRPEADPTELVLRGLSLGLRDQANRILRSVPDYYTAYGFLAEARAAVDLIENLIQQALGQSGDDSDAAGPDIADEVYPEGVYL